ncbi:zinc finger BED domain-containing protein 4-like isoform X2 [Melanotaenia boesemani]|uniref:zinc finger BED domain-containing protein 4-like isoform X2 n=1 Tax=Melanotaenia boesemani TaxID=1250792 RepID=UPI001C0543BB|nr:zinc finger BED domain-containing protein 4-like isoform X2 [Melanotaenia boesemani]
MLQSILEQKRALSVYAADHNLPATVTANQWTLMERTAEVLAPFEELTRDVSKETATAADVIPAITALRRVLSREQTTDQGVRTMKSTLLEAVETCFAEVEKVPVYSIATLVDPRYKDRYFTKSDNLSLAKESLIQEMMKIEESRAANKEPEAAEPVSKAPRQEARSSLGSALDEILEECQSGAQSVSKTSADVQMQIYLSEQTIPRKNNPLDFWKTHATQFPSLAAIVTKSLCAPCTSVDSERLFSVMSNILDEKRNQFSPEKLEMLIFLKKTKKNKTKNIHFILKP